MKYFLENLHGRSFPLKFSANYGRENVVINLENQKDGLNEARIKMSNGKTLAVSIFDFCDTPFYECSIFTGTMNGVQLASSGDIHIFMTMLETVLHTLRVLGISLEAKYLIPLFGDKTNEEWEQEMLKDRKENS